MKIEEVRKKRREILRQIEKIESMKRGTINRQYFKSKRKDSKGEVLNGPYHVLSRNERGKTRSIRLKTENELREAETAVSNYHRFQALCKEFVQLTEQLGELLLKDTLYDGKDDVKKKRQK